MSCSFASEEDTDRVYSWLFLSEYKVDIVHLPIKKKILVYGYNIW